MSDSEEAFESADEDFEVLSAPGKSRGSEKKSLPKDNNKNSAAAANRSKKGDALSRKRNTLPREVSEPRQENVDSVRQSVAKPFTAFKNAPISATTTEVSKAVDDKKVQVSEHVLPLNRPTPPVAMSPKEEVKMKSSSEVDDIKLTENEGDIEGWEDNDILIDNADVNPMQQIPGDGCGDNFMVEDRPPKSASVPSKELSPEAKISEKPLTDLNKDVDDQPKSRSDLGDHQTMVLDTEKDSEPSSGMIHKAEKSINADNQHHKDDCSTEAADEVSKRVVADEVSKRVVADEVAQTKAKRSSRPAHQKAGNVVQKEKRSGPLKLGQRLGASRVSSNQEEKSVTKTKDDDSKQSTMKTDEVLSVREVAVSDDDNRCLTTEQVSNDDSTPHDSDCKVEKQTHVEKCAEESSEVKSVFEKLSSNDEPSKPSISGWGFGNWGSSLLSTAATSVSSITNQVSQGIGTVLNSVEATLAVPSPEELVTLDKEREKRLREKYGDQAIITDDKPVANSEPTSTAEGGTTASLLEGVTAITKVFETTGTKVLAGGLDTLEMIGKKTFDMLTTEDEGKRTVIFKPPGGVNLSEILREAKEKAEKQDDDAQKAENAQKDAVHYSRFFDQHQGLVNLEALEMVSSGAKTRVHRWQVKNLGKPNDISSALKRIQNVCEDLTSADDSPDEEILENFDTTLQEHLDEIKFATLGEKLKMVCADCLKWLKSEEVNTVDDVYRNSIETLAQFTARVMEIFNKAATLLVVGAPPVDKTKYAEHAAVELAAITTLLCAQINALSASFTNRLNTAEDAKNLTPLITNVYLEASNSVTYVEDGLQLLVPVLQSLILPEDDSEL